MSNSINSLSPNPLLPLIDNPLALQLSKLPPELLATLKAGDLAQLEIMPGKDGLLKGNMQINGQSFTVNLNSNLLSAFENMPTSVSVRMTNNGQLQLLRPNEEQPQAIMTVPEKNIITQVELSPLKLAGFIDGTLQEMRVPAAIRQQIVQDIAPLQVSAAAVGKAVASDTVLQPLYNVLQQIAETPDNFMTIKPQLTDVVNQLVGQQISGEIAGRINDMTVVKTPLGDTFFDSKIKLPLFETLVLDIKGVASNYNNDVKILDSLLKIILPHKETAVKAETPIRQTPLKILTELSLPENAAFLTAVAAKLPLQQNSLLENIYNFYQGAVHKDLSRWLGHDLLKEITADTVRGARIVSELNTMLSTALKETPVWRIVEMPLFDGSQFASLKVAVKKEADKEKGKDKKQKSGTRFIVETNFSKLGGFQFDGFSNAAKRSLDLIIRTSSPLEDDFCSNVINLFKKSLYNLDYVGTIKINRQENFINLQEENTISEGIYV